MSHDAILFRNRTGALAASLDDGLNVVTPTGRRLPYSPVWVECDAELTDLSDAAFAEIAKWDGELDDADAWEAGKLERAAAEKARKIAAAAAAEKARETARAERLAWLATPEGIEAARQERIAMDRLIGSTRAMIQALMTPVPRS